MTSTRGTRFVKDDLLANVQGFYDDLIAKKIAEAEQLESTTDAQRLAEWRPRAIDAVYELANRLSTEVVSDKELAGFEVPRIPTIGYYRKDGRQEREGAERLTIKRDKALAFARSLAADADGVVVLYAADLRRIGYEL